MEEPLKYIFFYIPRKTYLLNVYRTETVRSGRKLIQYCQLLDKNPHVLSTDILNVSRYLEVYMYLAHDFSRNL